MDNNFKKINLSIYNVLTASTAHGVPNIIKSYRSFHKFMWTICTLVSSGVCSWFIYISILKFLDFSVVTNIQNIYEQPTLFPTVSICSDNRTLFRQNQLKTLLNRCVFNYDRTCKTNPEAFFEPFEETEYGLCYRFNSGKNMSGHTIPFLYSTIGGMDDSLVFELISPKGLIVWVHNSSTPPKREFMNNHNGDIKFASAGTMTHLVVDRVFDSKLGEPFNQCLKDANEFKQNKTLIDYINSKGEIYQQVNCLEICFDLDYITNIPCNCTGATIGKVWEVCYRNASSASLRDCTMDYKINFYKQKVLEKCSSYCPLECDSNTYHVSTVSLYSPDNNRVTIFVYYRTLKYTLISQQPEMVLSDLVSNIGGLFGLFIGISFLSFIEIFEIITEIIFILYESSKTRVNFT